MKACKFYPEFEPNQVLTAEQLNQLTAYLEEHQRLTRSKLIGAGVVCGFEIIKSINNGYAEIKISNGCGSTSEGYFMSLCDDKNTDPNGKTLALKYKRDYADGAKDKYPYFLTGASGDKKQIDLWELLYEKEDEDCEQFADSFLSDKALIFYLEISEKDYKSCTGSDCDEKGKGVVFCLKKLLIKKSDLNKIIIKANDYKQSINLEETINARFQLSEVTISRVGSVSLTEVTTTEKLVEFYKELVKNTPDELAEQIIKIYEIYEPLFSKQYGITANHFNLSTLKNRLAFPQTSSGCQAQYHYDFLKDLILAYNEFRETAFDLLTECCIDENLFPCHLMIGDFTPKDCEPSIYRQRFIQAPIYNGQEKLKNKFISLYNRIIFIVDKFLIPSPQISQTRITPSKEKETVLSERSIPFYYQIANISEVKKKWNFELARKCKSSLVYSFYENTNSILLAKNIDDYPFLRVEGLCGKEFKSVYSKINEFVAMYRLPVKVHGLVIGTEIDEAMEISHCYFSDLDADYTAAVFGLQEWYDEILEFLYAIKFSVKEAEEKEETEGKYIDGFTGVKGTVKDAFGNPYPGINMTLVYERKMKSVITDAKGAFQFKNLKPGDFELSAALTGAESIKKEITILKDKTLVLDLELKAGRESLGSGSGRESGGYYELPDELKKLNTREVGRNLKVRKKTSDIVLKEFTMGWLYENYSLIKNKVDTIDAITDFIKIIGEENLTTTASNFIQIAEKILKLIAAIIKAKNDLPLEMKLKSIEDYIDNDYDALLKTAKNTLKFFEKYSKVDTGGDWKQLMVYLNEIIKKEKLISLEAVYEVLKERIDTILKQFLFHEFAKKYPGLEHQAGTIKGGTLLIVYDQTGYIVADFMLPFICCSDCPPITLICESKKEPPQISMDEYEFCEDNKTPKEVYVTPEGGEVLVNGDHLNPGSNDKYFITPSELGIGSFEISYVYEEQTAKAVVTVYEINADFSAGVEVDEEKGIAVVSCLPVFLTAESYEWDFGDGTILNAENFDSSANAAYEGSALQNPVHHYSLSEVEQKIKIKLKVKNIICEEEHTEQVTLPPLQKLTFNITPKEYCKIKDDKAVAFSYKPDGVVNGDGTFLDPADKVYKFLASRDDVNPGTVEFTFTANDGRTAKTSVEVVSVSALFDIKLLSISMTDKTAKVQLTAFDKKAEHYQWKESNKVLTDGKDKSSFETTVNTKNKSELKFLLKADKKWCSDTKEDKIKIGTCDAKFELSSDPGDVVVYITAVAVNNADTYKWIVTNKTTNTKKTYTTKVINLPIKRTDVDQQFDIKLIINDGDCTDESTKDFVVEARVIENAEIIIDGTRFCRNQKDPVAISGTPAGGKVLINGKEAADGLLYPSSDLITNDKVVITYLLPDGRKAAKTISVVPIAKFETTLLSNSNDPSIPRDNYVLKFKDQSLQVLKYKWSINGETYADNSKPKDFRIQAGRQNIELNIELYGENNKCYDRFIQNVLIPRATTGGVDITGGLRRLGITFDNTSGRFNAANNMFYLIADPSTRSLEADEYRGSVKVGLESLNNIKNTDMFEKTFTSTDNLYTATEGLYEMLGKDFSNATVRKGYTSGSRNKKISNNFDPLFEKTFNEIKGYRGPTTTAKRQFAYNVMLLQISQLLQLATKLNKDVSNQNPLVKTMLILTEYLSAIKGMGVDINPDNQLKNLLMTALEMNADKSVLSGSIERLTSVLG